MKITITDAAKSKIKNKLDGKYKLLLNFDDGVGNHSDVGSCAIGISFDLLAVSLDDNDPAFDETLESDLGPIYIKGYSKSYLDQGLKLDVTYNELVLKGDAGMLDGNVALKDER
ncbi:iron-sulfur cluster biosynthesis family protein [Apilactobacillus xinyiensis]|uniref:Iron-sulfur cluster biosynthesis family protein n=1 Tax=Apilactobacillus xinyiensis TaxID=2841032 RepID=A0ABT0I182_9LACO|nr:iron-sulfur cluster biosynthesis family protein [Apilactobacillus xinyiensis]MCK8624506.1 iron-sulfur cluster biosynthesis family protein [Apilactobacillus xinyiensis]MCL0312102.1 iron-sulfur cluster biosynthesis family protein [Apilactobacillus xinyiensis]MCL0318627.1 iron-sulfur cluster biosynthesis family protein [Apilactobacillus xinyiensis]MCL0330437.1 iron-sulfur cluster biosynthesis family protein [Apilactobacillus xinyiensis]